MLGYIYNLESFATLEGGGIRYCVFMQGCNLKCAYCHNVDSQSIHSDNKACGNKNTRIIEHSELARMIIKNKNYYIEGGVTFSGGEPLLQSDYIIKVCEIVKQEKLHIAIDTSLSIKNASTDSLLIDYADLIIADFKFYTREDYKKHTMSDTYNNVIDNLAMLDKSNKEVLLRTVIVPDINDSYEDIEKYYEKIKHFKNIKNYELLPFHTMGFSKYEENNIVNPLYNYQAMDIDKLDKLQVFLNNKMSI